MNKTEITKAVAEKTGFQKKDVETIIDTFFDTVIETIPNEEVSISGIAKFGVKDTAPRKGRNPQTGTEIEIPAGKKTYVKALKRLTEAAK